MTGPKIVVVDIETRPSEVYAWALFDQTIGINQIIRPGGTIMVAAQWLGEKKVTVKSEWDAGGGYEGMMRWAHSVYDEADYVVTFNGARFDNGHLRAAWAELGLAPPSPWRDLDLYRTVKKFNWPSRKLAFVCQQLGLDLKTDPGGFSTWVDILTGEGKRRDDARRRMAKYCSNDVRITTQLFERLRPWIDGLNLPLYGDEEESMACNRCGSDDVHRRGFAYTTTTRYRRFNCQACGGWMRSRTSEPLRSGLTAV